jgi:hypothetical protein
MSRFSTVLLAVLLVFHSVVPGHAQQTPSIANGPQILDVQGGKIRVVPVAAGFYHPGVWRSPTRAQFSYRNATASCA